MNRTGTPFVRFALVGALLALTVACGGRQTPEPDDALSDPIALFEAMLTRVEAVQSVRMRAMMEMYEGRQRARVEQAIVARAPASLRMETISPFDTTLAVFIVDGETLTFFDPGERTYVSGAATPENVSRFVPLWMTAADLVRVLFGGPPIDAVVDDLDALEMSWHARTGTYRLHAPVRGGGHLVLFVRHGSWVVETARSYDADGERVFELRAGDFEAVATDAGTVYLPRRLRFLMAERGLDLSLDVTRVEAGVTLPDAVFTLPPPAGAEHITL